MTDRERELLGYIGRLLLVGRNAVLLASEREIVARIAEATREDRAKARQGHQQPAALTSSTS